MSVALSEALIELSDPIAFRNFEEDVGGYFSSRGLSQEDREVLLSRNGYLFRRRARSSSSAEPSEQFNRLNAPDVVVEVSVDLHLVIESNDLVAVGSPDMLFVDSEGRLYRALPE